MTLQLILCLLLLIIISVGGRSRYSHSNSNSNSKWSNINNNNYGNNDNSIGGSNNIVFRSIKSKYLHLNALLTRNSDNRDSIINSNANSNYNTNTGSNSISPPSSPHSQHSIASQASPSAPISLSSLSLATQQESANILCEWALTTNIPQLNFTGWNCSQTGVALSLPCYNISSNFSSYIDSEIDHPISGIIDNIFNTSSQFPFNLSTWTGIYCDPINTSLIAAIHLPSRGLAGPLSTNFSRIIGLRVINLNNNSLTGPIPNHGLLPTAVATLVIITQTITV